MNRGLGTSLQLPIRERRAVRARVRRLAHDSGTPELDILALVLFRVRAADRTGMTAVAAIWLDALAQLLAAEINLVGGE